MSSRREESADSGLSRALSDARLGDPAAQARLVALCRNYVRLLAQSQLESGLQAKVDASDIAQQTLVEAWRAIGDFQGSTTRELLAWLKQIVVRNSIDAARFYKLAERRALKREVALSVNTAAGLHGSQLAGREDTPSQQAVREEDALLLADAIAELPEDYQQAIICRSLLRMPFAEVAQKMDRSRPAVQMLWARAVERLRLRLLERGWTDVGQRD